MSEKPDFRDNDAYRMAERCADVIQAWRGKKIDPDRHGLHLIADFAYAIYGMDAHLSFTLVPKENPTADADQEPSP